MFGSRKETMELFADMEVLSAVELEARHEIELHSYVLKIQIESRVGGDLAQNHIIPTAIAYQNRLLENVRGLREVLRRRKGQEDLLPPRSSLIEEMSDRISGIMTLVERDDRGAEEGQCPERYPGEGHRLLR